jgi:hypothetical protein
MVLYGDHETASYFFVHPFSVTQDVPSRFGLIEIKRDTGYSLLKIPLEFISPDLQESIRGGDEETVSLEEYIRAFKLGNIKYKKRLVVPMKNPSGSEEPGGSEEPAVQSGLLDNPSGGNLDEMPPNASLFQ